ncbi:cellulase family glycosylhydrolase [Candidatus Daviesbacteria bacterium]|nr:cellulase family glycosylhydrolase [Candidatus Daviesbacteria bacterium]
MKFLLCLLFSLLFLFFAQPTQAIVNPNSVPNNKFGIHIISASIDEASPAGSLVNSSGGDWGYITVLIESKDRDKNKWQAFFDDLRKRHLIPIVRLATQPDPAGFWKRPYQREEEAWANFLDELNWPTKNRYVIIYNEPNHATEWGNSVDAKDYAQTLNKTIDELKKKSENFFILNAGFDASAPEKLPNYSDQFEFMRQMNDEVPGIFNKLDGFASHSYPNPGFVSSPDDFGRGSVRTFAWEMGVLRELAVNKDLPIFITETGWKHSDGQKFDPSLPSPEKIAQNYKIAFEGAWNSNRIVAVTPFLLNYQETPFDHFSFQKNGEKNYHPQFVEIKKMPKLKGRPIQEDQANLVKGKIFSSLVAGENYAIALTFKNIGQSIWNEYETVTLQAVLGGGELEFKGVPIPKGVKVEPGQDHTFLVKIKAPGDGKYKIALNLFRGNEQFSSKSVEFETEVKSPVILQVKAKLRWKENSSGDYILGVTGVIQDSFKKIALNSGGESENIEMRQLLPEYTFEFSLRKPYYKSKSLIQNVKSGINTLDFGILEPDFPAAILNPKELWKLLPFSN